MGNFACRCELSLPIFSAVTMYVSYVTTLNYTAMLNLLDKDACINLISFAQQSKSVNWHGIVTQQ